VTEARLGTFSAPTLHIQKRHTDTLADEVMPSELLISHFTGTPASAGAAAGRNTRVAILAFQKNALPKLGCGECDNHSFVSVLLYIQGCAAACNQEISAYGTDTICL